MKRKKIVFVVMILAVLSLAGTGVWAKADAEKEAGGGTRCRLKFELRSWSVFYRTGKGEGTITCDNGQKSEVTIKTHGGGVSFGKEEIQGDGTFSKVWDIKETYGGYTVSEAHASAHGASGAQAMWNGRVSLALSGTGKGWSLGFAFGKFKISPK